MDIITYKNFSWRYSGYKGWTLHNINLSIKKGEFIGIIGKIGSGRTTFCSSMLGLIPHFYPGTMQGEIIINGLNVKKSKIADLSKCVGLAFQSPANQLTGAGTTVEEELAFGLQNLGVPYEEMHKRVDDMLNLIGLEKFRKRSPFELSGGQQQKVAIASVLIMNPNILVLDEPTSQLDPLGTEQVFDLIKKLSKTGITIMISTNNVDYLSRFADRIILFDNKIVKIDTPKKILTDINLLKKHSLTHSNITEVSLRLKKMNLSKKELAIDFAELKKEIEEIMK
ncbi:MAG: ABC transporter ATP-binding protein [Candidatus Nanoarchaeia archaeon]|nr:ABC transporter ATP-binding protein [Candidatus Nanoarchaeia archaeon]MDD5054325.1 ABC transporter ATP-binding protein [Candidatus Nanoarchaeia archaeon]MDD5499338.1 ABC transporter ATP-binding protein [Candidatus Nanoarchaeia archaeon]